MKVPAFLGTALETLKNVAKGVTEGIITGLARLAKVMDRKTRLLAIAIAASALCLVVAAVIGALIAGSGERRDGARTLASPLEASSATALTRGGIPTVPRGGPPLASMLLIPGLDDWPWPLALEPKARYTEADAAEVRPDLGAIDLTELSARRKAELETIFSAVD